MRVSVCEHVHDGGVCVCMCVCVCAASSDLRVPPDIVKWKLPGHKLVHDDTETVHVALIAVGARQQRLWTHPAWILDHPARGVPHIQAAQPKIRDLCARVSITKLIKQ